MSKGIVVQDITHRTVNTETGEIHEYESRKEFIRTETEPFFFTYSRQIVALYGLSCFSAATKVLWKFLEFAEWNTGKVYMDTLRRNEILEDCNISKSSYERAIRELLSADIITRSSSSFIINPSMFWRGDRAMRKKLMDEAVMKLSFTPMFEGSEEGTKDFNNIEKA